MTSKNNPGEKNNHFFCKSNNLKLLFAPIDNQRSFGVVERMKQTPKSRLGVMRSDHTTPFELASTEESLRTEPQKSLHSKPI